MWKSDEAVELSLTPSQNLFTHTRNNSFLSFYNHLKYLHPHQQWKKESSSSNKESLFLTFCTQYNLLNFTFSVSSIAKPFSFINVLVLLLHSNTDLILAEYGKKNTAKVASFTQSEIRDIIFDMETAPSRSSGRSSSSSNSRQRTWSSDKHNRR